MSKLRLRLQQRLALQPSTLNPNRFARSGAVRSPVRFGLPRRYGRATFAVRP